MLAVNIMTIAIGILCADGIVLAADRQFTHPGVFKYSAIKLSTRQTKWVDIAFVFSGPPALAQEVEQKVFAQLQTEDLQNYGVEALREVVGNVLNDMGKNIGALDGQLMFFMGFEELSWGPALLLFDGRSLYTAKPGIHVLGVGDISLVRYLQEKFASVTTGVREARIASGYLVKKAIDHVDYSSGPIDVMQMNPLRMEIVPVEEVDEIIRKIEAQEELISTLLLKTSLPQ
jgi:20S proteasome alpha/beta subunit